MERDEVGRKSSVKFQNKKHFSKKWMPQEAAAQLTGKRPE